MGTDSDLGRSLLDAIESEKLASLSWLSAGVVHQIKDPAAFVLANLRALEEQLESLAAVARDPAGAPLPVVLDAFVAEVRPMLADAIIGMQRVHSIARELQSYAQEGGASVEPTEVNQAVDLALMMLRHETRYRTRIERSLGATRCVSCGAVRLGQVLMNLILNAAQALDEARRAENRVWVRTWDEGDTVLIEVRDNGPGVAPDVSPRIFEPLFTTRSGGAGAGLGLPISREIVRAAGGELTLEPSSATSMGAIFRIRLPAARPPPGPSTRPPKGLPLAAAAARSRILAVDDEALLLTAFRRMMQRRHDIETARGGAEALARLAQDRAFDVILCDLMMPEMTGMELYREVESRYPEVTPRFVFLTGGVYTASARRFLDETGCLCLQKPVEMQALLETIERLAGSLPARPVAAR